MNKSDHSNLSKNYQEHSTTIPVYEPYLQGREKEYVNQCLDSTWISSCKGEFIERFEQEFASYIGAEHVTSVANGPLALHLALETLELLPGDEVILPVLACIATLNAILQTGATPVCVDSLEHTWQMDPQEVRRKLTPKTKAMIVVHLHGLACDLDALQAICLEHQLTLIEDCTEAFGTYYNDQHVGTFGDLAIFSFYGNKTITAGEGGMVVTKTEDLWEKAHCLKTQALSKTREYWHNLLAYDYRMTNINAAIALAQLEQADTIFAKKRQVAEWYKLHLEELPLKGQEETLNTRHSNWVQSVMVEYPQEKQALRDYLRAVGIDTRPFFYPAHTLPYTKQKGAFPVAMFISYRGINLPSSPNLKEKEIILISEAIERFYILRCD